MALIIVATASTATAEALSPLLGAIGLGLSFVDLQCAAGEFRAVEGCDGLVSFCGIRHFDKCEAAGASGFTIGNDADFFDGAVGLENSAQL